MTIENSQDTPLGVLLIATFWMFIGTGFFVTAAGSYNGVTATISALFGMLFIFLGWGLLTLKKWSFYLSIIFAVFGSLYSIVIIPMFFIYFLSRYSTYMSSGSSVIYLIIFFAFIPMLWYLNKKRRIFIKESVKTPDRICPSCQRAIPFDANICPYCERKFEDYL